MPVSTECAAALLSFRYPSIDILSCKKGTEQHKGYVKNKAEINWSTEYKSEAYKYTIKMIAR